MRKRHDLVHIAIPRDGKDSAKGVRESAACTLRPPGNVGTQSRRRPPLDRSPPDAGAVGQVVEPTREREAHGVAFWPSADIPRYGVDDRGSDSSPNVGGRQFGRTTT